MTVDEDNSDEEIDIQVRKQREEIEVTGVVLKERDRSLMPRDSDSDSDSVTTRSIFLNRDLGRRLLSLSSVHPITRRTGWCLPLHHTTSHNTTLDSTLHYTTHCTTHGTIPHLCRAQGIVEGHLLGTGAAILLAGPPLCRPSVSPCENPFTTGPAMELFKKYTSD